MWSLRAASVSAILLAAPAGAHPHIFIDAGLGLVVDDKGQLIAVEVRWTYDEFYSLVIVEDWGLDADRDGVLSREDASQLAGFDLQFSDGYTGALEVLGATGEAALGDPIEPRVSLDNGQLVSTHIRPLKTPLGGVTEIRTYDPTYYASIVLTLGATLEGAGAAGCAVTYQPADLNAASSMLEEMLFGPDAKAYSEDDFPAIGIAFADAVTLSCAPPA
ncbi:MAG: DUF1007 family protein [Pseudomonadota bacterium]